MVVPIATLWLPILLSAVFVFIASSIIHMVLPYHHKNYRQLPDEDKVRAVLRSAGLTPGLYNFPFCTPKQMNTPEAKAKYVEGPVGFMTIFPNGPVVLSKFLILWFLFCLIVSIFAAYLSGHTTPAGHHFRGVLRVAGTSALLAYGVGTLSNGIWKGQPWKIVFLEAFDGFIYALVTGSTFAWLWPQ